MAATNADIYDESIFRADLKDRFHEIIVIPPLRERTGDISLLTDYFLLKINKNVSFDKSIYEQLEKYSWPGNVRQLEMWINRICRKYRDVQLTWKEIPNMMKPDDKQIRSEYDFPELPVNFNDYISKLRLHALDVADGNKSQADRLLTLKDGTMKQWVHQRKKRNGN